jgi:ATP-dependent Lon protease
MEKTQREYYLNEQMKAIQKELGDGEERNEIDEIEARIKATKLSKEAKERADAEVKKLRQMSPMSAEATVVRNYLDWLLGIPWGQKSKVKHDLKFAEGVLDSDHFGLDKVKERILEYLAVQSRTNKLRGPILCLVGPPGVGKTSLGKSIAKATGREFIRMSLGGVRDEAEIRGHRRTYIGSMPGKVIQSMKKAKKANPLFLLDEIDKMGMDFRGDPSAALARSARSGTELDLHGSLSRGRIRPLECDVRDDVEHAEHSAGICLTAWRSSASPVTRKRRSLRSPSATSFRRRWSTMAFRPRSSR